MEILVCDDVMTTRLPQRPGTAIGVPHCNNSYNSHNISSPQLTPASSKIVSFMGRFGCFRRRKCLIPSFSYNTYLETLLVATSVFCRKMPEGAPISRLVSISNSETLADVWTRPGLKFRWKPLAPFAHPSTRRCLCHVCLENPEGLTDSSEGLAFGICIFGHCYVKVSVGTEVNQSPIYPRLSCNISIPRSNQRL